MPSAKGCLKKSYKLQCTNELQLDATVFALVVSSFEFVNSSNVCRFLPYVSSALASSTFLDLSGRPAPNSFFARALLGLVSFAAEIELVRAVS